MKNVAAMACLLFLVGDPVKAAAPAVELADRPDKVSRYVAARSASGEPVDVLIRLDGDANLGLIDPALSFEARVAHVVTQLRAAATRSQAGLLAELQAQGVEARSLWLANAVAARLTPERLAAVAKRDDVQAVESDAAGRSPLPRHEWPNRDKATSAIAAHVQHVRAPEAWALGYRGQGVVVAGQDTGYQWDHPALVGRYRGWDGQLADHERNWHDAIHGLLGPGNNACGLNSPQPCDDDDHGTHTMGIVLGAAGADQIGVAPDARWIACRNMERGIGRPSTYIECYQYFLAPTDRSGQDPDPAFAPHIITNSWICVIGPPPDGEDCAINSLDAALANVRAAGILNIAAAGNDAFPECSTIYEPPALSADVFTVGATRFGSDAIAPFSLWGPVTIDGSNRLKPDVVAPGASVRSSVRNNAYDVFSGTSMATPNVAGVAALVLSANPALRGHPAEVERILRETAVPLPASANCGSYPGAAVPNAVYGHGRVDALAAVQAAIATGLDATWSGTWYDPARDGEGWILEILDNGTALLLWFTYPPAGAVGDQQWIIAQNGQVNGRRIEFADTYVAHGGRFGPAFDPAQVALDRWGTLTLEFSDCGNGTLSYAGPAAFGSATRSLRRLTSISGMACGSGTPGGNGLAYAHTGIWYDPARSGEGWVVESLGAAMGLAYWFTYTPTGELAWMAGVGPIADGRLRVEGVQRPVGTRFGAGFDPVAVDRRAWGTLEMTLESCNRARFSYASGEAGFGNGSYSAQRLARPAGLGCIDP